MALIRDTHTVSFLKARVRDGGIPCGSCKKLDASHKRHPVKKAAIEASSRVSQAGHKQVLLDISDVPRILTRWRAMQPCSMPLRRWRREEINAAREAQGNNASRDGKGRHSFCSGVHYINKGFSSSGGFSLRNYDVREEFRVQAAALCKQLRVGRGGAPRFLFKCSLPA